MCPEKVLVGKADMFAAQCRECMAAMRCNVGYRGGEVDEKRWRSLQCRGVRVQIDGCHALTSRCRLGGFGGAFKLLAKIWLPWLTLSLKTGMHNSALSRFGQQSKHLQIDTARLSHLCFFMPATTRHDTYT